LAGAEERSISDLLANRSRYVALFVDDGRRDWVAPPYVALTLALADPCQPSTRSILWQGTHPHEPVRARGRGGFSGFMLVLVCIDRVSTTSFRGSRVRLRTFVWLSHAPTPDGRVQDLPTDAADPMKRPSDQPIARTTSPFARHAPSVTRHKDPIRSSCTHANPSSSLLVEAPQAVGSRIASRWTMGHRRLLKCNCVGSLCNSSGISSSYSASESDCIAIASLSRRDRSR
jgi:hypothetical protein